MTKAQRVLIALLLLPVGFLAGTDVFEMMGNMPAAASMPLTNFIGYWQPLDVFMEPRMPIFTGCMFLLFLASIVSFWKSRQRPLLLTLIGCLALELAATIFTVTQQIPVNRAVRALDPRNLSDSASAEALRKATLEHFNLMSFLCISAFIWLVFVVVFSVGNRNPDADLAA